MTWRIYSPCGRGFLKLLLQIRRDLSRQIARPRQERSLLAQQVMWFLLAEGGFAAPPFMPDHSSMGAVIDL